MRLIINTIKGFLIIVIFFLSFNALSRSLIINGLSKLSVDDLKTLTSIDLDKKTYSEDEINLLLKDFYKSDLIFDVDYIFDNGSYIIDIQENKLIENIYLNGNNRIDDNLIKENISLKENGFLNKNFISEDINLIKNIYKIKGFNDINIAVSTEKYSVDRVNVIFDINEGSQSKIKKISFKGNESFSDRYLLSLINSKATNIYNIFSTGSNLNDDIFNFDINKIISFYNQKGFFDAKVNYNIEKISNNNYILVFFISEGSRLTIDEIDIENDDNNISNIVDKDFKNFLKKLSNNNFYYDQDLIDDFIIKANTLLIRNNIYNEIYEITLIQENNLNKLSFIKKQVEPKIVNKITIYGNEITKDETIRSKIFFQPGDYFNQSYIESTRKKLLKFKYINDVKVSEQTINAKSDINIEIDENKKTGQFLAGGTFSGDSGAGLTVSLKDNNLLGTGNNLDTNFTLNEENSVFQISVTHYPLSIPNIRNSYSVFNTETDLTNSFGFESDEQGISYSLKFDYNEDLALSSGFSLKKANRHSAVKTTSVISDNIGKFDIYSLNFSIRQDSTNDYLYPTDGTLNSAYFEYSPEDISDDSYYKLILSSNLFKKSKNSNRFIFLSNKLGLADSFDGKLKSVYAYSLGGMNFKGFDYRGIGPRQDNIYLGGNKFFSTTVGYGGSFLFDDNDNINTKLFYSLGSIWDSDYASDNDLKLRSSIGVSFDVLSAIGPISLSYAIPIDKNTSDRTREFNFSIGTSF